MRFEHVAKIRRAQRLLCCPFSGFSRRAVRALRGPLAGLALGLIASPATATPPDVIVAATYGEPVTRYRHDVLGKGAEWGALLLTVDTCLDCAIRQLKDVLIRLPDTRVFEDLAPRLIDLDGDNIPEVVVIESDSDQGARLAIYDETGLITATPFIGRSYRWLAPLGAADLDGDGFVELAYIDRPHLAKTLRVWRYVDRALREVAALPGLTNHRIGEDFISGGIRDCGNGPEIITADADWRQVMATQLQDGNLRTKSLGSFEGSQSFNAALNCQ